ncbi:MAG: histidine kinase [Anaerolineae bacterium]
MVLEPEELANELHDGVIQEMTALVLQLEIYQRRLRTDPDAANQDLERIKTQAKTNLETLRSLISRLRAQGEAS